MCDLLKQRGENARSLRELGFGVGDILEGDEGSCPDRILITAIGRDKFLCVWDYKCKGDFTGTESGNTTLDCRDWEKVGHITDGLPKPMSELERDLKITLYCKMCGHQTKKIWLNSMQVCETCMKK